jgi:signal transduction histidine kinase
MSFAQNAKIDSLLAVNNNHKKEDSLKVVYLTNVFRQYARMNEEAKMQEFANRALMVAQTLPQTFSQTYIYERLGLCYHGKGKYLQATDAYNNGIKIANARNDKATTAGFYLNLGALYASIPDYNKSIEAQQISVALYKELGDKDMLSSCYMNLGSIYNDIQKPVQAVNYINKALVVFKTQEGGFNYGTATAYQGIAKSFEIANDNDLKMLNTKPSEKYYTSLRYLDSAIKVAKNTKDGKTFMGDIDKQTGNLYEKMGNQNQALKYYEAALETISPDRKETFGNLMFSLGGFYYRSNNFSQSKYYLYKSLAIANETGLLALQQNSLEKLSGVYAATKQYDSAFILYSKSVLIKDSIFNTEKEKEITRKQLQLDFSIKENDYRLAQQVSDSKLKQQELQIGFDKKVKLFLALSMILILSIGGLVYYDRLKTKKLNLVINKQKTELEKLGSVKDKIFSVVSHDMRAPVNSLISFIDLLENGNITQDKLTVYSKNLKQNLTYTSALMNNLLNWAASQMQGFKPVKENVDLSKLLDDVINTLDHHSKQKNIRIINNIGRNTIIETDVNMTAAVLRNLLSNAIKFSFNEAIIKVNAEEDFHGCTIYIADEGTGMQPEQISAFNSNNFHRAESKKGTANEKGTGLGLLLCKTFIQQMGGTLTAQNNNVKGTTLKIFLTKYS